MKIVIDTETTGLNPAEPTSELLQVAIIDAETKQVLFNEYIKPQFATSWDEAIRINHITPEMVAECQTIDYYAPRIKQIVQEADEIIGYNIKFDLNFLAACGHIHAKPETKITDVMHEYAENYGEWSTAYQSRAWVRLVEAAEHFGYDWDDAPPHDALGDVYATFAVYNAMRDPNLCYLCIAHFEDGTQIKGIEPYIGLAKRMLYEMEHQREGIKRSDIYAIDQDAQPFLVVSHPSAWR